MTPSFRIGQEVEIIGPAFGDISQVIGECGKVAEISERENYRVSGLWYPASSLRLVSEELKIGDWVQVIGPVEEGFSQKNYKKDIFKIGYTSCDQKSWFCEDGGCSPGYPSKSLRKLTPEEVQAHLHPEIELSQDVKKKIVKAFLAQIARSDEVEERLAAIQDRLKEDRNLMMEIEERLDDRQDDLEGAIKTMGQTIGKQQERLSNGVVTDLHHRIEKLENHHRREEMPDCKPNDAKIRVSITRGGIEAIHYSSKPCECIEWAEKVLDGMRSGKL